MADRGTGRRLVQPEHRAAPEHLGQIFAAATADPRVADAFVTNFNHPAAMWQAIESPEATGSWLEKVTAAG